MKRLDLTGQRFGFLTVICLDHVKDRTYWSCKCDCGRMCVVCARELRNGDTISCGCYQHKRNVECHLKHGLHAHPLYSVWAGMLERTGYYNVKQSRNDKWYKNRGICVCDEWKDFKKFYDWSIQNGYKKGLQIDRINNDVGYSPNNCRWTTIKENQRNKTNTLKLLDGTPFADFLDVFNITDHNTRCKYSQCWSKHKKIHPELKQIIFETMD